MKLHIHPADIECFAFLARSDYPPDCTYTIHAKVRGVECMIELNRYDAKVLVYELATAMGLSLETGYPQELPNPYPPSTVEWDAPGT